MEGRSVRLDQRVVTVASVLIAAGALITLLAAEGTDAALARTALVLAVVAFVADLLIALVTQLTAAQTEARLRDTNTQMQAAISKVEERTEEIRHLVRLQGERLLDMVGRRLVAEAPPAEREHVEAVIGQMRDRLQSDQLLEPPRGGKAGRKEEMRSALQRWIRDKGYTRVALDGPADVETFEFDDRIYAVAVSAGDITRDRMWSISAEAAAPQLRDDWPGREVWLAVVIEPPELSGWDGAQPVSGIRERGIRLVTVSNLDDILLGPPTPEEMQGGNGDSGGQAVI